MQRPGESGRIVTIFLLICAACLPGEAPAQHWKPVKNVELIVPGGAGGGQDRTVRIMQKIMQQGLVPTTISVSNHPDAQARSYQTILAELGLTKR